jgi:hypothetical protein
MFVDGTIELPAVDSARHVIAFTLAKAMRRLSATVIAPAQAAGPADLVVTDSAEGDVRYEMRPRAPLAPSLPVVVRFSYEGGEAGGVGFYLGDEVSFATQLTSWYPLPVADDRRATGRLRLTIPAGRVALADEMRLVRRSSDPAYEHFEFDIRWPTYFVFLEGPFHKVTRADRIPVSAYLLGSATTTGDYLAKFSTVVSALEREFGSYPFKEFTLVGVPRHLLQRSGTDGTAFLGGLLINSNALNPPDFALALPYVAHEATHQWFPFSVRIVPPGGRYMAEALAQYGSLVAYEAILGANAAQRYRTHGAPDWGDGDFSMAGYFKYAVAGYDMPLSDLPEAPDGQRMMYVKGMLVWQMLSDELGRDRFRRAMRAITAANAGKTMSWPAFWTALEKASRRNLSVFHHQWFAGTGAPTWNLAWSESFGSMHGTVSQDGTFASTVAVRLEGTDGQVAYRRVRIDGPRTTFTLHVGFAVRSVTLDPDERTLHWTKEYRTIATVMAPVTRAVREGLMGQDSDLRGALLASLALVPTEDSFGLGFMLRYRLGEAAMNAGDEAEARMQFELALASSSRCTDRLPWLYFHLARFAKATNDQVRLRWAVGNALVSDSFAGGHSGVRPLALGLVPTGR